MSEENQQLYDGHCGQCKKDVTFLPSEHEYYKSAYVKGHKKGWMCSNCEHVFQVPA